MKNPQNTPLSNKEMAALLFNIATVLRDQGNQNPWRTRAYERAARALMGLRIEAAQTLSEGDENARVPFGKWQHIGKRLHAKIGEMVQKGSLAQFYEMLGELPAHQAALMTIPGIGPRTADRIYQTLGIASAPELFRAARNNDLLRVPGMGQKRVRAIAALAPKEAAGTADETWDLFSVSAESNWTP